MKNLMILVLSFILLNNISFANENEPVDNYNQDNTEQDFPAEVAEHSEDRYEDEPAPAIEPAVEEITNNE